MSDAADYTTCNTSRRQKLMLSTLRVNVDFVWMAPDIIIAVIFEWCPERKSLDVRELRGRK
jgi:hypothetical protein